MQHSVTDGREVNEGEVEILLEDDANPGRFRFEVVQVSSGADAEWKPSVHTIKGLLVLNKAVCQIWSPKTTCETTRSEKHA